MKLMSFVLVEKNERYLLIKEASPKSYGKWFFPGGKVDEGETPEAAAVRETKEEAGCEVNLNGLICFRFFEKESGSDVHIYYLGNTGSHLVKGYSDEHSLEARWFTYEEMNQLELRQDALEVIDIYRKKFQSFANYRAVID